MPRSWFKELTASIIERIEQRKLPLIYWLLSFVVIALLRMYIEDFTVPGGSRGFFNAGNQIHEFMFYAVAMLVIAAILHLFTRTEIKNVFKTVISFSPIILAAPVIDYIVTLGQGWRISYVYDLTVQSPWIRFITLGGEWSGGGATPGIKIEILFILAFIFLYIWSKTGRKIKSMAGSFLLYCYLSVAALLPWWVAQYYSWFGLVGEGEHTIFGIKLLLLVFLIISLWLYKSKSQKIFLAILAELRISRIIFYLALLGMGLVLSVMTIVNNKPTPELIIDAVLAAEAIILSSVFLMMVNDREDYEIDKVSNPERILPSGRISELSYSQIGIFCIIFALLFAAAVGVEIFFLILLGNLLFVLYSAPPFKLKNYIILSKMTIASAGVVVMTTGFLLDHTRCSAFLPTPILISLWIGVLAGSFVIDLKDFEGDKKAGVITLPVKVGLKNAKLIISTLVIIAFVAITLLLEKSGYILYSIILGLLVAAAMHKKPYNEPLVFFGFILSLIYFSIVYLFF
ncbi:UbiA family prenyltransferase [Patescibacteria group bacterium]|nr:UbiA family prenyltransferase [Patescibacteria group bacterium]MBU0964415.1 UbiA family prenyltransferase [Patescibacteria group bacterium]